MARHDPGGDIGKINERIDITEFTGLNQRGDVNPMLGAPIGACEQRVLAVERDVLIDRSRVFVAEFEAPVVDEAARPSQLERA